jgi:hypothetical protein
MKHLKKFNENDDFQTKPGFVERRMELKAKYEKNLLEWYMKGFDDEISGRTTSEPDDKKLLIAYRLGAQHAIIGDDVSSIDDLTNEEIIKQIEDLYLKKY